jgi:ABC-type molybdate transport system substrate-binding protein
MLNKKILFVLLTVLFLAPVASKAEQITLYAAGSLKAALSDVTKAFEQQSGNAVVTEFGPSGLLREKIEQGAGVDVFASANMGHPHKLVTNGQGGPVVLFTRNNLCALAQPQLELSAENLLAVMLDPATRLGTSTPKADPSGDYAWELFAKAERLATGSTDTLSGKALQLTGGPDSPKAPAGRNQYAWVMENDQADLFLTYCTNAVLAQQELPQLKIVSIPEQLSVGADYGLIVLDGAPVEGWRLAMFILSPQGQKILAGYGFVAAGIPAQEGTK